MLFVLLTALLAPAYAAFPAPERSTAPITIIYPAEKAVIGATEYDWTLGSVSTPSAHFSINGQTVAVHKDGAFLAWIPVAQGTFTLNAVLLDGATAYTLQRQITVTPRPVPLPEKPVTIERETLVPRVDEELRAGDWLLTRARATPGAKLEFRVGRKGDWQPMRDVNPAQGLYEGSYLVIPDDQIGPTQVEFRAKGGMGKAEAQTAAKVSFVRGTPAVASVRGQALVMVKTGPGEGDLFQALGGTRFVVGGRKGSEVKLLLSNGQTGWLESKYLEFLPPGAHPPRAETDTVGIKAAEGATVVRVGLGDRVPFVAEESEDQSTLFVRFHYTYLHTNWMVYNAADDYVDEVRLKQETADVVLMTIRLKPGRRLWGFWPAFEGNALRLELKHPPALAKRGSPLQGVRVMLDPGHMPSAPGAIGPLGTKEMDVNYAIAAEARALLQKEGAVPLMTRASETDEVSLVDRPRLAVEKKADLFISVHNNFLPSGQNPFKGTNHGYSVFYYHPHSLELARSVYEAYGKHAAPLPGEDLRFGNLLVCRVSAMPAILTESAYLTYPEQEALLLARSYRVKLAQAIVDGARAFLEKERRRQLK